MKKIIILLVLCCTVGTSMAQYKVSAQGSSLKFIIKNLGFGVDGTISGFEGIINFNAQDLTTSNFDVSLNAATINTDNSLRDEHLRGDGFFDVKTFPRIRLVSAKVTSGRNGSMLFNGELTIKGKTKPVSFPFNATPVNGNGYVFTGSFKIHRKDFGVGGTSTVSDELEIMISALAKPIN